MDMEGKKTYNVEAIEIFQQIKRHFWKLLGFEMTDLVQFIFGKNLLLQVGVVFRIENKRVGETMKEKCEQLDHR